MSSMTLSESSSRPDSDLVGSTLPRIWTPRDDVAYPKTLAPMMDVVAESMGFGFDDWQRLLSDVALEVDPSVVVTGGWPRWAHRVIAFVLARQNGKTTWLKGRIALGLFVVATDRRITHTAQDRSVPRELFEELVDDISRSRRLRTRVKKVTETNGRERILLKDGSRYQIKAPTPKMFHGPPNDLIIFDELRFQSTDLWGSGYPSQSARPNPQIIGCSNAGDATAEQLARVQKRGRAAAMDPESDREMCYLEWSAHEDRDVTDPQGWVEANPNLGRRISVATIRDELIELEREKFETERLSRTVLTVSDPAITREAWEACAMDTPITINPDAVPRPYAAVHMSGDRTHGALAIAAVRSGKLVVEVVDRWDNVNGVDLTDAAAKTIAFMKTNRIQRVAYVRRRAAFIADRVTDRGLEAVKVDSTEMVVATQALDDAITNQYLAHPNNEHLNLEVARTGRHTFRNGEWVLSEAESGGDICGVMAMAFAVNLAYQAPATSGGFRGWIE